MADKTIGELPVAPELEDESLLVVEQQSEARRIKGSLVKDYAVAAAKEQADAAAKSAAAAKTDADRAAEKAKDAADVALHPPILKEGNDHWWTWDTGKNDYVDSGIDAGVSLDVVEEIVTGNPGTKASVKNLGTKTDPTLQFTIPKGDKGDAATVRVGTVTTTNPGTQASVTNTGTVNDAVLNFSIPRGSKGDTGPQGIQGPIGPAGGVDSVNGQQGDVVMGSTNLVAGTNHGTEHWQIVTNDGEASLTEAVQPDGTRAVKVSVTKKASGYFALAYRLNSAGKHFLAPSAEYAFAMDISSTVDISTNLQICYTNGQNEVTSSPVDVLRVSAAENGGFQTVRGHIRTKAEIQAGTSYSFLHIYMPGFNVVGEHIIKNLRIVRGNTDAGWTPAPEDYLGPFNAYNITNMHRNIFRGENLGSTFTAAQKAAIAAGTWDNLYLGDYWTINTHTWRIADFDYWLGKGDTSCTKHHIVVVPDASLYSAQMHNTDSGDYEAGSVANTTAGGYYNSDMRKKNLANAKSLIDTDFGTGSILNHRILLTNAVEDGYPSAETWCDSEVDLMNEMMVYGAYHFTPKGNGTFIPYNNTTEYTQLALFQAVPYYIMPNRSWYWLKDVVSATHFAAVAGSGNSSCYDASRAGGVRPAVGIVGA